jgi:hypothetical protein
MLPDGSYSYKDKQVGRVLKESDGLYKNECGVIMWMIQNGQLSDYKVMPLMILVMKMVKVTGKTAGDTGNQPLNK